MIEFNMRYHPLSHGYTGFILKLIVPWLKDFKLDLHAYSFVFKAGDLSTSVSLQSLIKQS